MLRYSRALLKRPGAQHQGSVTELIFHQYNRSPDVIYHCLIGYSGLSETLCPFLIAYYYMTPCILEENFPTSVAMKADAKL